MSGEFDLRSKEYWYRLGWGVLAGLLSAIGALIFMAIMNLGLSLLWPEPQSWEPLSGSWTTVAIMTVAGVLVGLVHQFTSASQPDVFEAVNKGGLDPRPVPASLLAALISLIGGFSLGPEVPTGMLGAGFGTWLSERRKMADGTTRTTVLSSVSGVYAGLFSSPFVMLLILLESAHVQSVAYYGTLFIGGLAAVVGFGLFYVTGGDIPSDMLGLVKPPSYDLRMWHVGMGIVFGILAVPVALVLGLLVKLLSRLVAPLNSRPVIRGTVGGLLLGLLGMVLPITLFLGTEGLVATTSQAAEIGVVLLIVFVVAKLLALSGALSFGFIGGPVFPLMFAGGTLGAAINLVFPQIPLGLAVGCMTAAVPSSVVAIPLALAALTILILGVSPLDALPVVVASLTAFSVTHGLGLIGRGKEEPSEASS